jgi:hypothetical protein
MAATDRSYCEGWPINIEGVPPEFECYDLGDVITIFDPSHELHIAIVKIVPPDAVGHAVTMLREAGRSE